MGCTYNGITGLISGNNRLEVIRQILLQVADPKIGLSIRRAYLLDLNFYSSIEDLRIREGIEDWKRNARDVSGRMRVTGVGKLVEGVGNKPEWLEWTTAFSLNFGTGIHHLIEATKSGTLTDIDAAVNELRNAIILELHNLQLPYGGVPTKALYYLRQHSLLKSKIDFILNADIDHIITLALDIATKICNTILKGPNVQLELLICDDKAGILGHPDAFTWDKDGNITIYDFKTALEGKSILELTLKDHYTQLAIYRLMLSKKFGIPESKIKIYNVNIDYGASGLTYNGDLFDIDSKIGEKKVDCIRMIRSIFPAQAKVTDNIEEKKQQLYTPLNTLTENKLGYHKSPASLKKRLMNAELNGLEIYLLLGESEYSEGSMVTIKKNGDKYTLYNREGTEKIKYDNKVVEGTLDEIVNLELKALNEYEDIQVKVIIEILRNKNLDQLKSYFRKNTTKRRSLYMALSPYCSNNWTYKENQALEACGIIQVYNEDTKVNDFIMLVDMVSDLQIIMDPNKNILDNVVKDKNILKEYREYSELPAGSIKDFSKLQALAVIATFSDTLEEDSKIGAIKTLSTKTGQHDLSYNTDLYLKTLHMLKIAAEQHPDQIEHGKKWIDLYQKLEPLQFVAADAIAELDLKDALLLATLEGIYLDTELSMDKLDDIRRELKEKDDKITDYGNNSPEAILYRKIGMYQARIEGLRVDEMHLIHSRSLTIAESLTAGINLISRAEVALFTRNGLILTGIAQGLASSISYANPDELIRRTHAMFDAYTLQIAQHMSEDISEMNNAIKAWFKSIDPAFDFLRGDHKKFYKNLMQSDDHGKIDKKMLFKNPYDISDNSFINQQERYALEVMLWTINRSRMGRVFKDPEAGEADYKTFSTNSKYADDFRIYKATLKTESKYLLIPLIKRHGTLQFASEALKVLSGSLKISEYCKRRAENLRQYYDPSMLSEEQAKQRNEKIEKLDYYNRFAEGNKLRAQRIEKSVDVDDWNLNFNLVICEYVGEHYKTVYYNKFLSKIDRQLGTIKIMEIVTGKDLSKQFTALKDSVKIKVYNVNISDEEDEDLLKITAGLKHAASLAKLALRPGIFIKEMILGRIRNISTILTNNFVNDEGREITMSDLLKGFELVFSIGLTDDLKIKGLSGPGDFWFANLVNNVYLINDRDISVLGENLAYDRYGAGNWGERMLYLNTVSPDWVNRMALFLAKMSADGTLLAHSRNERTGLLDYDMSKDDRYSYFWNNRLHPELVPVEKLLLYNKQKLLYLLNLLSFIDEGFILEETVRKGENNEYTALPRAYTTAETDSAKEQIGLIYGYYAHEERANIQKGLWWNILTLFLTFLPAEIRKYFADGKTKSMVTKVVHVKSPLKDPKTGKLLHLYYQKDKNGLHKKIVTENDNGRDPKTNMPLEPVLERVEHPVQGLFTATLKSTGRLVKGDFKEIVEDEDAWNKTKLFMFNSLFAALVAAVIGLLAETSIAKVKVVNQTAKTLTKVGLELWFWDAVIKPVGDMGNVGVDFAKDIFTNSMKSIKSENISLYDASVKMFPIMRETVDIVV